MVLLGEHSMYIFKVSIRAKLSQIFQVAVSYHMRHVYRGVPPAHEEYEYSTCILSTSKGEAIAIFENEGLVYHMYHMCPWPFWLKPKFTEDKLSVIHVF